MDGWALALEDQLNKQNETFARCTAVLRSKLSGDQIKRVNCGKCDSLTWIGSLVKFPCERRIGSDVYNLEHSLCFDCLEDKMERHRGFLDRERSRGQAQRALYDRCLECIICCEECHTPAVIQRIIGYEGGITDDAVGEGQQRRRVRYCINEELTHKLRDKFKTHSFCENQRRSPFSKFSRDRLFTIERPNVSDEKGNPVSGEQTALESGFVWLEDWRTVANVAIDEVTKKLPPPNTGGGIVGATAAAAAAAAASSSGLGATGGGGVSASAMTTDTSFIRFSNSVVQSHVPAPVIEELSQTVTDPSGWQYAFIWPSDTKGDGWVKWMNKPTANTYVRRRRKTRACLALTPELKEALQNFLRKEQQQQKG